MTDDIRIQGEIENSLVREEMKRDKEKRRELECKDFINKVEVLKEKNEQLRKALKEAKRMLKHYGSRDTGGMAIIDAALENDK